MRLLSALRRVGSASGRVLEEFLKGPVWNAIQNTPVFQNTAPHTFSEYFQNTFRNTINPKHDLSPLAPVGSYNLNGWIRVSGYSYILLHFMIR